MISEIYIATIAARTTPATLMTEPERATAALPDTIGAPVLLVLEPPVVLVERVGVTGVDPLLPEPVDPVGTAEGLAMEGIT